MSERVTFQSHTVSFRFDIRTRKRANTLHTEQCCLFYLQRNCVCAIISLTMIEKPDNSGYYETKLTSLASILVSHDLDIL